MRHKHKHTKKNSRQNSLTSRQLVAEAAACTTHRQHKRRTFIPSAGSEPTIPGIKLLQASDIDSTIAGVGNIHYFFFFFRFLFFLVYKMLQTTQSWTLEQLLTAPIFPVMLLDSHADFIHNFLLTYLFGSCNVTFTFSYTGHLTLFFEVLRCHLTGPVQSLYADVMKGKPDTRHKRQLESDSATSK